MWILIFFLERYCDMSHDFSGIDNIPISFSQKKQKQNDDVIEGKESL